MNQLILAIDLDEWFHCPWYTGSETARWESPQACFNDYYNSDKPGGEIVEPTRRILAALRDKGVKATFFILGEVAMWYPDLIRGIAAEGHEVGCHGLHHIPPNLYDRDTFAEELKQAKSILEDLSGRPVIGYRAPNLEITPWLFELLIEMGFKYDSSICPGIAVLGKYKYEGQSRAPLNPYRVDVASPLQAGQDDLIEIPIPTFPILKLPGAVSIATRMMGWTWTRITLDYALRKGATNYYMHPYEFNEKPKLKGMSLFELFYFRHMNGYLYRSLGKLMNRYGDRIVSAEQYITNHFRG